MAPTPPESKEVEIPAEPVALRGIRRLTLDDVRDAISPLHDYLRARILDGTLLPGTKLSQAALARQLGVSRTPLREVLRMLQEEGLVDITHNQRTVVAPLCAAELDQLYASRIALEALAVAMTAERFGPREHHDCVQVLETMRRCTERGEIVVWRNTYRALRDMLLSGAHISLRRQLSALVEQAWRYVYVCGIEEPRDWLPATNVAYSAVVEALGVQDVGGALVAIADHLGRTSRRVLAIVDPEFVPIGIPHSVELLTASLRGSQTLGATG